MVDARNRHVAQVDEVDATQIRRAVVVAGLVRRELICLGSWRTRLDRGVAVGTDNVGHLILVVQSVDRTHT